MFAIANHFNSKGGDQPLFGRYQPPSLVSEPQRVQQATLVNGFVAGLLTAQPDADIIVLGDFNDFPWSAPLQTLKGDELTNLMETLPAAEQYNYIFDGNSQALDHILVTSNLMAEAAPEYDIVHVNAEFPAGVRASDHDPHVAYFAFSADLSASTKTVSSTRARLGDTLTYTVTLRNTGNAPVEVRATDQLLPFLSLVDPGVWQVTTSLLQWEGMVAEGASIELPFTVQLDVAAPLDHGSTFRNAVALLNLSDPNAAPLILESPLSTLFRDTGLTIDKSVEPVGLIPLGTVVTYTVRIANSGETASGVTLSDTLPAGISFGQWVNQPTGAGVDGDHIGWQGDVAAADPVVMRYTGVITTNENYLGRGAGEHRHFRVR